MAETPSRGKPPVPSVSASEGDAERISSSLQPERGLAPEKSTGFSREGESVVDAAPAGPSILTAEDTDLPGEPLNVENSVMSYRSVDFDDLDNQLVASQLEALLRWVERRCRVNCLFAAAALTASFDDAAPGLSFAEKRRSWRTNAPACRWRTRPW